MPFMEDNDNQANGVNSHSNAMDMFLESKKLVLCFDGTGNTFSGSNADTNVVKILNKLDRHAPRQFHYYQTGIGTYDINEKSVNKSAFGEMLSSLAMTIDQAIGNTFDAHVMAGYRFLMKYYDTGAKIYMFGFSRGAFTAKFLARMINTVGLLCKGNEEMVPFAYRLYQKYLAGEVEDFTAQQEQAACQDDDDHDHDEHDHDTDAEGEHPIIENANGQAVPEPCAHGHRFQRAHDEITAFSNTFCRKEQVTYIDGHGHRVTEEKNIKVYFLGIWDCVNSVAPLERKTPVPVPVKGTAKYVRHAVAVDERRVKFKPALLSQDIRASDDEDLKEVWFPGCHGDVGGGWPAEEGHPLDSNASSWTIWQSIKNLFTSRKPKSASKDVRADPFQMSDIPLAWMIRELELVGEKDKASALQWSGNLNGFKRAFEKRKKQALSAPMHDSLLFGRGTGFFTVLLWKYMEWLPIITRWELEKNVWVNVRFPLNKGATRDIPRDAHLHESLVWRLKNDPKYSPHNNHGGFLAPCLKHNGVVASLKELEYESNADESYGPSSKIPNDPDHTTFVFAGEQ